MYNIIMLCIHILVYSNQPFPAHDGGLSGIAVSGNRYFSIPIPRHWRSGFTPCALNAAGDLRARVPCGRQDVAGGYLYTCAESHSECCNSLVLQRVHILDEGLLGPKSIQSYLTDSPYPGGSVGPHPYTHGSSLTTLRFHLNCVC